MPGGVYPGGTYPGEIAVAGIAGPVFAEGGTQLGARAGGYAVEVRGSGGGAGSEQGSGGSVGIAGTLFAEAGNERATAASAGSLPEPGAASQRGVGGSAGLAAAGGTSALSAPAGTSPPPSLESPIEPLGYLMLGATPAGRPIAAGGTFKPFIAAEGGAAPVPAAYGGTVQAIYAEG